MLFQRNKENFLNRISLVDCDSAYFLDALFFTLIELKERSLAYPHISPSKVIPSSVKRLASLKSLMRLSADKADTADKADKATQV